MKTFVIYHANCTDGFCAAWLFSKAFPDAIFVPAQYGQKVPYDSPYDHDGELHGDIDPGDQVFIVDFSYPREDMLELWKYLTKAEMTGGNLRPSSESGLLLVLDHHKTAQKDCEGLSFCRFDMDKSGAMLAFDFIQQMEDGLRFVPTFRLLVEYIQDRDLWQWKMPDSRAVNAAVRSYPFDFHQWDGFLETWMDSTMTIVKEGEAILRYRQQIIDQHVKNATEIVIGGYQVLGVCCTTSEIISEVAEALITYGKDTDTWPFGVCWFDIPKEGKRVFSLRSCGDFDVSEIAKKYGGGGHKNAAGFSISSELLKI